MFGRERRGRRRKRNRSLANRTIAALVGGATIVTFIVSAGGENEGVFARCRCARRRFVACIASTWLRPLGTIRIVFWHVQAALSAGVASVQYRHKTADSRLHLAQAQALRALTRTGGLC